MQLPGNLRLATSRLGLNMVSGTVAVLVNLLSLAVSYPIYLRLLGPETLDLWLVLSALMSLALVGTLGINQALTKLVAEECGRGRMRAAQGYVSMALQILAIAGAGIIAIFMVFPAELSAVLSSNPAQEAAARVELPLIGLLSVYFLFTQMLTATLAGLGRVDLASYSMALGRVAAVASSIVFLSLGMKLRGLILGSFVGFGLTHGLSVVWMHRASSIRIIAGLDVDRTRFKRLATFGGVVLGGTLMQLLLDPFSKIMLGRYGAAGSVTVLDIAYRGAMVLRELIAAAIRALMPEISRIQASDPRQGHQRIEALRKRAFQLGLLAGVPVFGAAALAADYGLRIWLGQSFIEGLPLAFRGMAVAALVSLLGVPAYFSLMGTGGIKHCTVATALQSLANVAVVVTAVKISGSISPHVVIAGIGLGMALSTLYLSRAVRLDLRRWRQAQLPEPAD